MLSWLLFWSSGWFYLNVQRDCYRHSSLVRFILKKPSLTLSSRRMFCAMNGFVQENLSGFNVPKLMVGTWLRIFELHQNLQESAFEASSSQDSWCLFLMDFLRFDLSYRCLWVISGQLDHQCVSFQVQHVWQVNQPTQTLPSWQDSLRVPSLHRIFRFYEPDEVSANTVQLDKDLTGQVISKM